MLELVPLRFGTPLEANEPQEYLIRVVPPIPQARPDRAPLNLSLVLDRSGSMRGEKFRHMLQGASQLVLAMHPRDRVSVVLFGSEARVLVESTPVRDKTALLRALSSLSADGNTALHGGWKEGVLQVIAHRDPRHLNRVLLLTDGEANVGQCSPRAITQEVARLGGQGVTTSTLGFGRDYNEDLLKAMALAGDGNHYFIEHPRQLPEIFQVELGGLMATLGQRVRLSLRAPAGLDVLTPLERDEFGALRLNDLIAGNPLGVLVRVWGGQLQADLTYLDLASGQEMQLSNHLELPRLPRAQWSRLPACPQVVAELAMLRAAQAQERAAQALQEGQTQAATELLRGALDALQALPAHEEVRDCICRLEDLLRDVEAEDHLVARKKAYHGSHAYYKGQYRGA